MRKKILAELLETEQIYVDHLRLLKNHYLTNLQDIFAKKNITLVTKLFTEATTILNIHEPFLKELASAVQQQSEQLVAEKLLFFGQSFKLYIPYIQFYAQATQLIAQERQKNVAVAQIMEQQAQLLKQQNWRMYGMSDLLILPIQRIPSMNANSVTILFRISLALARFTKTL